MHPNLEQKILTASSGEELTQLFRNLSFEGLGDYGLLRLKEIVPALSNEKILKLMTGHKTLSGHVDRMSVIDETPELKSKFNKDLAFICRGLFRHTDGKLYRPYAYVADYCNIDALCTKRQQEIAREVFDINEDYDEDEHKTLLSHDIKRTLNKTSLMSRLEIDPAHRVKHYAKSDNDLAVFISGDIPNVRIGPRIGILCEEVTDEPPTYFDGIHATPDAAFANMINKHAYQIDRYGYRTSYTGLFGHVQKNIDCFTDPLLEKDDLFDDYWKAYDAFFDAFSNAYYQDTKEKVLNRSMTDKFGWVELKDEKGSVLATVPRLPFMHWAFKETKGTDKLPRYKYVSSIGLKVDNDNPLHSDWMIGGGLDLKEDYSHKSPIQAAANEAARKLQVEELDFECMVLASGNIVTGHIKHCTIDNADSVQAGDIVVIPKGSIDYQLHVQKAFEGTAGGVITTIANRVAHLVKVSREQGITMIVKPDAFETLPDGSLVTLNPDNGTIRLVSIN